MDSESKNPGVWHGSLFTFFLFLFLFWGHHQLTPACICALNTRYGDEAECDHGNGANTFTHLLYLPHDASSHDDICSSVLSTSALHVAEDLGVGNSGVNFQLQDTNPDGDGSSEALAERLPCVTVSGEQALSMFLRKIFLRAGQVFAEENPEDTSHHSFICSLTAPSCLSEGHRARICTAAEGAGFDRARVTTNVECLAAAYLTRHVTPVADSLEFPFLVGFVDYGHAQFSVGLAVFYRNDSSDEGVPGSATYAVLSERSVLGAAGQSLDLAMAQHFAQQFATRKGTTPVSLKGRKGKRLVRACSGAKHALSLNPQARFMVDAMGQDGDDARFEVSRDEFVKFCSPQFDALRTAICEAMVSVLPSAEEATAGGTKSLNVPGCSLPLEVTRSMLGKVELVGGGSRSPVVQSIVAEAMGLKESQLSYTLDIAMSLSQGAAVATNRANEPQPAGDGVGNAGSDSSSSSSSDHVANLRKQEVAWATLDDRMREIHSQCNQLEAFISSMRTAIAESSGAPDGERMDSDVVGPILDQAEELTWAPWAPDIGARCEAKRKEIDDKIRELCSGYFAKKAADRAKYENAAVSSSTRFHPPPPPPFHTLTPTTAATTPTLTRTSLWRQCAHTFQLHIAATYLGMKPSSHGWQLRPKPNKKLRDQAKKTMTVVSSRLQSDFATQTCKKRRGMSYLPARTTIMLQ